ncbi:MAG TPA: alanine racemase, partial [Saprospiraceae bacterium]|nr:alanine racemase [Saprospiraceae bacterium]
TQCRLSLVVVNPESLEILGHELKSGVHIWIKIDVGTHRTGIGPSHLEEIDRMMDVMDRFPLLHFSGFLGHAGHSYASRAKSEAEASYRQSVDIMSGLKKKYLSRYPLLLTSLGDTPGVSMTDDLRGVDELRPGNFVFYDLQQQEIGSCTYDDIAVALACSVVAIHPERLQWIIYGGGIHFAKDFMTLKDGRKCFGRMIRTNEATWTCDGIEQNPFLISLSQEHGVVQCTEENFNWRKPGDLTLWLPVHSCMTADLMAEYLTLDGQVIDHYRKHTHP